MSTAVTAITGFIRPPPDIRKIVDKTAQFIGKMGDEFESKIMANEVGNLKFAFLKEEDPYHAYYRHRVQTFRSGGTGEEPVASTITTTAAMPAATTSSTSSAILQSPDNDMTTSQKTDVSLPATTASSSTSSSSATLPSSSASSSSSSSSTWTSSFSASGMQRAAAIPNPVAKALKTFDPGMLAPKDIYTIPSPALATPEEIDLIKLTAQFTAAGGRSFLANITAKEYSNPLFDFLKTSHPSFGYFTALVDTYARILHPQVTTRETIARFAKTSNAFVENAVHIVEWRRLDDAKRREAAQGAEAERISAQIDWHDFVIVETIDFEDNDDEDGEEVSGGKQKSSVQIGSGSNSSGGGGGGKAVEIVGAGGGRRIDTAVEEMEMEMDMETDDFVSSAPGVGGGTVSGGVGAAVEAVVGRPSAATAAEKQEEEDNEDDEAIHVRHDYVSRVGGGVAGGIATTTSTSYFGSASTATGGVGVTHFIDPVTGRTLPIEAATEHMRVELLDPKWKEQTARAAAKHVTTLYAGGEDISENLRRLAASRGDVFRGDDVAGGEGGGNTVVATAPPNVAAAAAQKRHRLG